MATTLMLPALIDCNVDSLCRPSHWIPPGMPLYRFSRTPCPGRGEFMGVLRHVFQCDFPGRFHPSLLQVAVQQPLKGMVFLASLSLFFILATPALQGLFRLILLDIVPHAHGHIDVGGWQGMACRGGHLHVMPVGRIHRRA